MTTLITSTTLTSGYQLIADSTGTLVIQTGSGPTTAMTINASQNVGIGTPSPAAKLDIFTSSAGGFHYPIFLSANNSASAKTNYLQLGFSIQQALAGSETGGFDLKALRNNTPVYLANYEGAAGVGTWKFYTDGSERLKITTAGTLAITQAAGTNTIDVSGNATSIANGGTVGFANASGMLVVNNHTNGNITIFLGGGGTTSVVSSVGAQVGTFAYTSGIGGYTWTSNYGSTATYAFYFLKTRPTA